MEDLNRVLRLVSLARPNVTTSPPTIALCSANPPRNASGFEFPLEPPFSRKGGYKARKVYLNEPCLIPVQVPE